jgi:serine protease AprX
MGRFSRATAQTLLLLFILPAVTSCVGLGEVSTAVNYSAEQAAVGSGTSYIVQARSAAVAAEAVAQAGGMVARELQIIDAVQAILPPAAIGRLEHDRRVLLHGDTAVRGAGTSQALQDPQAAAPLAQADSSLLLYPAAATGVHELRELSTPTQDQPCQNKQVSGPTAQHNELLGWGVTVAVIDSGFMRFQNAARWEDYDAASRTLYAESIEGRCIVYRDFLSEEAAHDNLSNGNNANSTDQSGHGTHVISTIADARIERLDPDLPLTPVGVAPKVNLFIARALDRTGAGNYSDVIDAIQWIIASKNTYKIRVLNLSLYAPVSGPYWSDPLNQAVMKAWQAGLVVVVSAGNEGPEAGTITVPGNVPYVITVGALRSARYNLSGVDELAAYSSRGPTESAFIKPDVLVSASRTIAPMPDQSDLASQLDAECKSMPPGSPIPCIAVQDDVDYGIGVPARQHTYFYLSGTSMAAAEVSGIAALMLQVNPSLTNDEIKGRLMGTALPSLDSLTDEPVYAPWEQGAGRIDAQSAIFGPAQPPANSGMDIAQDLDFVSAPPEHYWGTTEWDEESGTFIVSDPVSGDPISVWTGRGRVWSGSLSLDGWAGGASLWAGRGRVWSGATPNTSMSASSGSELLTSAGDGFCLQYPERCAYLPDVTR